MQTETNAKMLTCPNCGHTGADVHEYRRWVRGQGSVWRVECENIMACWERREANELTAAGEKKEGQC